MNWFTKFYPQLNRFIVESSNIFNGLLYTLSISFGSLLILAFVISVEITRVKAGIEFFDADDNHANAAATIVVIGFLMVSAIKTYAFWEAQQEEKKTKWSLRKTVKNGVYILGFKQLEQKGKLDTYASVESLISLVIVVLAGVGSVRTLLERYSDLPWYEGLLNIFTQSNFVEVATLVFATLFTIALVTISKFIIKYITENALSALSVYMKKSDVIKNADTLSKIVGYKEVNAFISKVLDRRIRPIRPSTIKLNQGFITEEPNIVYFFDGTNTSEMFEITDEASFKRLINFIEITNKNESESENGDTL